jgi:dihydrofolate synthase/folylpolyglutamate synthase
MAICGILADKDAAGIVAVLRGAVDAWSFVTTHGDRGASGEALAARVAAQLAAPFASYDSIDAACAAALAGAGAGDRILFCGSFHTVGPALDWLEAQDI